jgi:hypothetical protein
MIKESTVRKRNLSMTIDNNLSSDQMQFKKHVVKPGQNSFEIGEFVKPDTIIGLHMETGQPVKAEIDGRIVTIHNNPANGSVMMIIISGDD